MTLRETHAARQLQESSWGLRGGVPHRPLSKNVMPAVSNRLDPSFYFDGSNAKLGCMHICNTYLT